MRYHYVAFNSQGQTVEGNVEGTDEGTVEELLWSQGLTIAQISTQSPGAAWHNSSPPSLALNAAI